MYMVLAVLHPDHVLETEENNVNQVLEHAFLAGCQKTHEGKVATYIPELGKADGNQLGICIHTISGEHFCVGDTNVRFSIQSISKVISLAIALELCGFDKVFQNVGMEPSGDPFNSFVKLEYTHSIPYNPMINAGAIVIASYLEPLISFNDMTRICRTLCMDPDIALDENVFHSEMSNISRNRAIAYLLESKGYIDKDVEKCLMFYVQMCSLSVTAESLAGLGLILANDGISPDTGERLLKHQTVQIVKTIMLTCGMYDGSGQFAVRIGIPSKSGVGGGILSVVDRKMGIGIYGPALDEKGNSLAGTYVLEYLSRELHLHLFDHTSGSTA